jgi:hypothetical protein
VTKSKKTLIILSLLTIMLTSSFFWLNSLVSAVESGNATRSQFTHISRLGIKTMLYQRLDVYAEEDKRWQSIARTLGKTDGEVAFKLAKYYIDKQDENSEVNRNIELWLLQASRLGHNKAKVALASIYVEENKLLAAKKILVPIKSNLYALTLLIKISVMIGDYQKIEYYTKLFKKINSVNKNKAHQIFYKKLEKYNIINSSNIASGKRCLAKIAPFATNLDDLAYFDKLISSSNLDPLKPYLCFSPVKYISKIELNCHHSENESIECNEAIWKNKNSLTNQRFVAVLFDKGGANVNAGILYIDSDDNEKVFFHELTHLLGFIDEYPLPKNHLRCSAVQDSMFSHNIVILPRAYQGSRREVRKKILSQLPWAKYILTETRIISYTTEGWMLGTLVDEHDTVGAFIAESCNENDFVAIRPLKQRTALRYFEEKFPSLYLQMLADNPERFLMPHYSNNVMKALRAKK